MAHEPQLDAVLGKENTVLVVAESKSFATFDRWMDEQLAQLVSLWIHTAAPNASICERARRQFGR